MSSSEQLSDEVVHSVQKLLLSWDSSDDDNEQGDSPLRKERNREERVYRLVESLGAPKITRVRFFLDRDKDFNVVIEGGLDKEKRFVICIMLNNHTRITCNECQAMQAALKATERGTGLTEPDFRKWATHFEKMSQKVVVGENRRGDVIMNVKPKPMKQNQQYETLPGVIQQTSFVINNNNNNNNNNKSDEMSVSVDFRTDIEKYSISVSLAMVQRSYADLQCQATQDVLGIAEQGDRMDTLIFLQHCAQLQQKYNLVTVAEQEGLVKVARVRPSKLSATEASVTLTSEFQLPPATEGAVLEGGEEEWAKKQLVRDVMKALEDTTDEADDIVRKGLDGKGTDGNAKDQDFEDAFGGGGESLDEDRDTDKDLGTAMEEHLGEDGVEPMDEGTASSMSLSNSLPQ